ncbi:hypothetical protein [Paracoccus sulfuroxidans]|uniref:Uncharacterized protein n=1 Tax=Paracoccus sulfuroxidans TaxID=384678 RepID=A0A562NKX4_9RHOB|nr:hypothetical protein [Paracoccus sulfuroxidans]TWI32824.1 hypothetical protein IQ24_02700 [Paracoccus sulfuroxidans]
MSSETTTEIEVQRHAAAHPRPAHYRRTRSTQWRSESEDELDDNLRDNPNVRRCYYR